MGHYGSYLFRMVEHFKSEPTQPKCTTGIVTLLHLEGEGDTLLLECVKCIYIYIVREDAIEYRQRQR